MHSRREVWKNGKREQARNAWASTVRIWASKEGTLNGRPPGVRLGEPEGCARKKKNGPDLIGERERGEKKS